MLPLIRIVISSVEKLGLFRNSTFWYAHVDVYRARLIDGIVRIDYNSNNIHINDHDYDYESRSKKKPPASSAGDQTLFATMKTINDGEP